jgi:hypothetical protein
MIKKILFSIILLTSVSSLWAQFDYGFDFSKAGSSGIQFLKIGVGARELAMGGAASAVVKDANAVFWNTAGLAYIEKPQASFTHTRWLVESQNNAAVVAMPVGPIVTALSVISFTIQDFEETTVKQPEGTGRMVGAYDMAIGMAVASRITDKFSLGGQIKYVLEKLDDRSASNILFDVGALYYTGFRQLRLGFSLQHYGPDMKFYDQKFRTPLLFRLGIADEIIDMPTFRLTTTAELVHPTDNKEWLNFGAEFMMMNAFALRAGYRYNRDEGKLNIGGGLRINNIVLSNFKLDYAYAPFGEVFDDIHRFSIGFEF